MSKEIREQINIVKHWDQFLNEGRLKQIDITNDILPYIESVFDRLKKEYGDEFELDGYTLSAFEFEKYHEYCPYGFDIDVDIENKRIHIDICSQNDGINMNGFKEAIYDEIYGVFSGTADFGWRVPFVKKTKYDTLIKT